MTRGKDIEVCRFCSAEVSHKSMERHVNERCPKNPAVAARSGMILCGFCGVKMKPGRQKHHRLYHLLKGHMLEKSRKRKKKPSPAPGARFVQGALCSPK